MPTTTGGPLSVSEITQRIKLNLESAFPSVDVEGELSNVRPASSGHIYFTLKDETAAISAVMFRGKAMSLGFTLEDGQQVVASGNISVYAKRGSYQIIVERLQLAGEGRILAELEHRKHRLAAEGLFDDDRKMRLPILPATVAVVTSPTGAALRDILQVLGRRNAGVDVVVCPTPVQGDEAAPRIARMIEIASRHRLGDVIIVGRGGGSLEDLLPFSDELVVRAIAASEVPVISAVGHEIDWALSDFVADLRAPTPSAAAEVVASSRAELLTRVLDFGRTVVRAFRDRLARSRLLLSRFAPDELHRLYKSLAQPVMLEFDRLRDELLQAMADRTRISRHALALAHSRLDACSPYDVLKRGYAIVRNDEGQVVVTSSDLESGMAVDVRLGSGGFQADVKEIYDDGEL